MRSNINGDPLAHFFTQFLKYIFIVTSIHNTIFNDACNLHKGVSALVAEEVLEPVSMKLLSWWHLSPAQPCEAVVRDSLLQDRGPCLPTWPAV